MNRKLPADRLPDAVENDPQPLRAIRFPTRTGHPFGGGAGSP